MTTIPINPCMFELKCLGYWEKPWRVKNESRISGVSELQQVGCPVCNKPCTKVTAEQDFNLPKVTFWNLLEV